MKFTKTEQRVLPLLLEQLRRETNVCTFRFFSERLGITRAAAKRACRMLACKGLAEHSSCWDDDGLAGSGYCITGKGIAEAKQLEKPSPEVEGQRIADTFGYTYGRGF